MAASPQVVQASPLFLTAKSLVYSAPDLRRMTEDMALGAGVMDADSFRVRQRVSGGANMSVDVTAASYVNRAWIRPSNDTGLYRVDYTSASVINLDIAAADPTNPRIDSIYLAVEDTQIAGGNDRATARVVTGTPTAAASLDNLTGVGTAPVGMAYILLGHVQVDAAAATIVTAKIRDVRHFTMYGAGPSIGTNFDSVTFLPVGGDSVTALIQSTSGFDAQQGMALMYLPKRIKAVTKIRFRFQQGGTANTNGYSIAICRASDMRPIVSATSSYTGSANQLGKASLTVASTDFEPGYYWVFIGNAAGVGSGSVIAQGVGPYVAGTGAAPANVQGQYAYSTTGGSTVPTTGLAFIDFDTLSGVAQTLRPAVPVVTLATA